MKKEFVEIQFDTRLKRMIPFVLLLLLFVFVIIAVRLQIGDMIGEFTSSAEPRAAEMARVAVDLAPSDPQGYWLMGAAVRNAFDMGLTETSLPYFENAARKGPYDYRWWTELGRAREQEGNYEQAEAALLRAVDLAPQYSIPRWHLGNFYLRRGRTEDSIAQLKIAARHNSIYRQQVFLIAWNFFGNDPAKVEQFAPDEPGVRSALARFYASQGRAEDALRMWNTLADTDKKTYAADLVQIKSDIFGKHLYTGALEFFRQSGSDPYVRPETVTNGGFEVPVVEGRTDGFDWLIRTGDPKVEISLDAKVRHSGSNSLRVVFKSFDRAMFNSMAQVVAVRPGHRYALSYWLRTEGLKSGGMPAFFVLNASNMTLITAMPPMPVGNSEWQNVTAEFQVPDGTDGILITSGRESCPDCAIQGTFWVDDFELRPK